MKKKNKKTEESPQQLRLFVGKEDADMRTREPKDGIVRKRKNTAKENAELQEELRTEKKRTAAKQSELDEEREKHDVTKRQKAQVEEDYAKTKSEFEQEKVNHEGTKGKFKKQSDDLDSMQSANSKLMKRCHDAEKDLKAANERIALLEGKMAQAITCLDVKADQKSKDEEEITPVPVEYDCFVSPDEKTLELVDKIVKAYYHGIHANLALIEITFYNHFVLKRRNHHKPFVLALIKRGTISPKTERELRNLTSGISKKMNGLPDEVYTTWDNVFSDDKSLCIDIGIMLGPSFPLRR